MMRMRRYMTALVPALVFLSASGTGFARDDPADRQRELDDISRRIKQQQEQLQSVRNQEQALLDRLQGFDSRIVAGQRDMRRIAADIKAFESDIAQARDALDAITAAMHARQGTLARRLRSLYQYQRRGGLLLLLGAESYHDFLMREKLLTTVAATDRRLLEQHHSDYLRRQAATQQLQHRLDELAARRDEHDRTLRALERDRTHKRQLLASVRQEKSLQLKALEELEEASRKLQSVIDTLGKAAAYRTTGTPFARMRGSLPAPVAGRIVSRFGRQEHPELHTFTFRKGIEIDAPAETPIRAVHAGRVVFADWFKGYGNLIIIDHGQSYYTLSAHASRLSKRVDETVAAGEVIAFVGDTASLRGPCLYFEIRHHGTPQNPETWLRPDARR